MMTEVWPLALIDSFSPAVPTWGSQMPHDDLERLLEGEVTAAKLLDALPRMAENGGGGSAGARGAGGGLSGGGEPSVEIEDGGVFVHNSVYFFPILSLHAIATSLAER